MVDPIVSGIGPLSENEVKSAAQSQAAIFTFNIQQNDRETVASLRVMEGRIHKDKATVRGVGKNKGGKKDDGDQIELPCLFRVLRGKEVVSAGTLKAVSLRKVKEAVLEVRRGEECGLGLDGFDDFEEGDVVECYSVEQKRVFV